MVRFAARGGILGLLGIQMICVGYWFLHTIGLLRDILAR